MFKPQAQPEPELFIASAELVRPATTPFYAKLNQTLDSFNFAQQARDLCASAYSNNGRGRPGVDPAVYFKMLMVGFFEDIASERIGLRLRRRGFDDDVQFVLAESPAGGGAFGHGDAERLGFEGDVAP